MSVFHSVSVGVCQVEDLASLERDQIVCVSAHKKFMRPQESQQFVELKANWAKACKHRGHQPADVNAILFKPPMN